MASPNQNQPSPWDISFNKHYSDNLKELKSRGYVPVLTEFGAWAGACIQTSVEQAQKNSNLF